MEMKSMVDVINEAREAKTKEKEMTAEEIETLRKCVNSMAGSEHGLVFFKSLVKVCRMYEVTNTANGLESIVDAAKRSVYLAFRQLLSPENKSRVES
jgi:hypothetical protein